MLDPSLNQQTFKPTNKFDYLDDYEIDIGPSVNDLMRKTLSAVIVEEKPDEFELEDTVRKLDDLFNSFRQ